VPFLHSVRDKIIREKARTMLLQEPLKDRHSGRDVRQNQKAPLE
jgi:hypothetical protein